MSVRRRLVHIVGIEPLKEELRSGSPPARDVAWYVFLTFGLSVPIWYAAPESEELEFSTEEIIDLAYSAVSLAVAALGVWACYRANGGPTGSSFAERFAALAWVLVVRFALGSLPVIAMLFGGLVFIDPGLPSSSTQAVPAILLAIQVAYFWRLSVHMGDLGTPQPGAV